MQQSEQEAKVALPGDGRGAALERHPERRTDTRGRRPRKLRVHREVSVSGPDKGEVWQVKDRTFLSLEGL